MQKCLRIQIHMAQYKDTLYIIYHWMLFQLSNQMSSYLVNTKITSTFINGKLIMQVALESSTIHIGEQKKYLRKKNRKNRLSIQGQI